MTKRQRHRKVRAKSAITAYRELREKMEAAAKAGDWAAHERLWEERRVAEVEADEAWLKGRSNDN